MSKKCKIAIGVVLLIALVIFMISKGFSLKDYTPQDIRDYIHSFGVLAPIVYIILFTLVPLTLFPDSLLAIAGGMCFGLLQGSIYTVIGALCGGTLSFGITRYLGRGFIGKLIKKDLSILSRGIEERGFWIIFFLRLIPLVPFDVISYSSGLANIKYKDFILATLIGIIPGVIVLTNIGDKATEIASREFYLSLSFFVVLMVLSLFLKKKLSLKRYEMESWKLRN